MASHSKRGDPETAHHARAEVHVLVGPAGSGKTQSLLEQVRRRLAAGPVGCALWLAPNRPSAAELRERLLAAPLSVVFQPNISTFAKFADTLVRHAAAERRLHIEPRSILRPISELVKRSILRRVVEDRDTEGSYFAPIAHTQGFIDSLADWISELKRAEIWPDELLAAGRQRGLTGKDEELAGLYRRYQELLSARHLYDREGRMWLARDCLERGYRGPYAGVRLVVADGFTDFTRTQYDMLESLAATADTLLVGLTYEEDAERRELFATTEETLNQLRRRFDAKVKHLARPRGDRSPPGLAALERGLFRHPRRRRPAKVARGVEFLEAPGREGEVRMLAQRVKQLLLDGVAPDEVAVVLRRLDDYALLFTEVFGEQGIPVAVEVGTALARCPVVKTLMAVLALPEHNWRFARLEAVLKSNYFRPRWPEWLDSKSAREILAAMRDLRIPFGRDTYLRALERMAEAPNARQGDAERASRARFLLQSFVECLDRFPKRHTPGGWIDALKTLCEELGLNAVVEGEPDHAAEWALLLGGLEHWAWAEQLHGVARIEQADFLQALGDILRWETLSPRMGWDGRVRILSASDVRNLRVPYLFVAGMAEGQFPQSRGEDPFYSEAERETLHRHGLALGHRTARLQEEMLLFYSVVTRAEKLLVFSYPAVDEQGAPLLASPFFEEVRRVFAQGALAVHRRELLERVPPADEVAGPADLRVRAVADAAEGSPERLAQLAASAEHGQVAENILAGLEITHARFQVRRFGPYDGIVGGTRAAEAVAAAFGPPHAFSPSQLNDYQTCPFKFYLSSVLGLRPQEDPDWRTSPAVRGQIVHNVLAGLHRNLRKRGGANASPADIPHEELLAEYAALLGRYMRVLVPAADPGMPLWDLERRLLLEWGSRYAEQHREYERQGPRLDMAPQATYFELSFGIRGESTPEVRADSLSVPEPLVLGEGPAEVRVCGRIDRVDVGRHGGCATFNVIDYKTGTYVPSKSMVQSGGDLQLPLYALAVERLFDVGGGADSGAAMGLSAGYWKLAGSGYQNTVALGEVDGDTARESEQWVALRQQVEAKVAELAAGIRQAAFPVFSADEKCTSYCPFATVCRINQVRSVEKPWPV